MANRTLWPLYHDAIITPAFNRKWWHAYCRVNQRFADELASTARKGDEVWIHDFHLQLVPAMLRALRSDLKIGFFLHIPFPPEELFEWLPWRRPLLHGLLGADLLGFQTEHAADNFRRAARDYGSARSRGSALKVRSRTVRAKCYPISIDSKWWSNQAKTPKTKRRALEFHERLGAKRKVLLAIDRLDYTKGIVERLQAFEDLLASRRASVNECVLIQIAVPSRETVGDYAKLRDTVERMVGRINGEFGLTGRVAVHYLRRNLVREELAAFYSAADVMLVTPLRDGMNLVAKEYVACRNDGNGVLVLSQFAGAALELSRALIVNPRDTDQMSDAMHRALTMEKREIRSRMEGLRAVVLRHDVHRWAAGFLRALRA